MKSLLQKAVFAVEKPIRGSSRNLFVALVLGVSPFASYAAQTSGGIGTGRLLPTAAAVIGLVGVIVGRKALNRTRKSKSAAIAAVIAGLISLGIGGIHAANAAGGFGTGNGLAGAIVAILLGLSSLVVGGIALIRYNSKQS